MKKLVLFGVIVLSVIVANTVTAGHGSGWPGHHGGRCFIETAANDNSVEDVADAPTQNDADDILAYRSSGGHGSSHGSSHGGHGGHGGHHGCFINTVSNSNWFEQIFDFIWRPRS